MEDKRRLKPEYLEHLAEREYAALKGKIVRVMALNGHANDNCSDTFHPDMLGKPVLVCVGEADKENDLHRWMDEWLDPVYPVELVDRGDLPESLGSCWIYGNSRSLDGGYGPGDIWAVVPDKALDIEGIACRLGGKVCDLPPDRRYATTSRSSALMPLDEGQKALERTDRLPEQFECLDDFKRRLGALERRVAELSPCCRRMPIFK